MESDSDNDVNVLVILVKKKYQRLFEHPVSAFRQKWSMTQLFDSSVVAYSSRWGNIAPNQNQTNARLPPIRNIAGISQSPHVRRKRTHNETPRQLPTGG
uniref:Uncharacterized protein n=1 Tax=Ditylenchus dipsaci TaxID=166011 RepID=A0A915DU42_9BILA